MLKRSLAAVAGLALSLSIATTHAAETLRVSAIPDEAPTELIRKFKPLGEYLEQQLGMPVKFTPVSDYAAVVESLASDRLDLAWLGGFTFVQTRLKTGDAIPLVQREQDEQFTSKFITADPEVKSLADLKGKTFAFGSVSSTSGSLMPRYFMLQDGIKPEDFFSRVAYSGAHDATAAWVQAGKADAGVHVNISGAGVVAASDRPEQAQALLEWLASDAVQAKFAGLNFEYPVKPGMALDPIVSAWGEFKADPVDIAVAGRRQAEAVMLMNEAGWR